MLRLLAIVSTFVLFVAPASAQSPILWSQASTRFSSNRIILDSAGNVYWVGVLEQPGASALYATKYSASGIYQGQAVFGVAGVQAPTLVKPSLTGNRLYIGFRAIDSYLAAIDITTMGSVWTKTLSDIQLWGIHTSASHVVTVEEQSSTLNYVRRRFPTNGNVTITSPLTSLGEIHQSAIDSAGHVYVVGSGSSGSTSRIIRANSGGSIHYDLPITFIGYAQRNATAIEIDNDNQVLWVGYYAVISGQAQSNALLRRFALANGSGSTWTFDQSVDDVIRSICPMGDGSVSLAMIHWDLANVYGTYLARRTSTGTTWNRNYTASTSMPVDMVRDSLGYLAVIRPDPADTFFNTMIVEKLDPTTGNTLWRHTLEGWPGHVLTTATGSPVFVSLDGKIHMTQGVTAAFSRAAAIGGTDVDLSIALTRPTVYANQALVLASSGSEVPVPATISLPSGATSVTRTISTLGVSANKTVSVNIRHAGFIVQRQITLLPPVLSTLAVSPNKVTGGGTMVASLTLAGKAPDGYSVDLSSSVPAAASVPSTLSVPAGSSQASFNVTTNPVSANTGVVITASKNGVSRTAFVAVNAPTLSTFTLANNSVTGGTNGSLTATLAGTAPTAGFSISLLSGAPALVVLPSSTSVPAGSTTRTLAFATASVTSAVSVTLVAYRGSVVRTQSLTLLP